MARALICGVSGQDGAYLARLLLAKGYEVFGASRNAQGNSFSRLVALGIRDDVHVTSVALSDFRSVLWALKETLPDEIYNLAGQTSVGLSFGQPVETHESVSVGTLNLLEAIRFTGRPIKLYSAGSSECFGHTETPANEETPFRPRSPYAVAKAAAFWGVSNYREAFDLFACTGILFNHESPLRPSHFVTRKVVSAACRIAEGSGERLQLGNLSVQRDWGWAPDYVDAMWRMLQQDEAEDFVVATGTTISLEALVRLTFECLGLDWTDHVDVNDKLLRPLDIACSLADPAKAKAKLGWEASHRMPEVVHMLVEAERARC